MEKRKRLVQVGVILGVVYAMCMLIGVSKHRYVQIEDNNIPLSGSTGVLIEYTEDDINVIPDKYNTGAKGNLITVEIGEKVSGIQFVAGSNATVNVLDFAYHNKDVSGSVIFENIDFSKYPIVVYHENMVDRNIKVTFNNCEFGKVTLGKGESMISYEFNNCTIKTANGSNAVFNKCKFGQSYSDGLVPFQNVKVNDCLFFDMTSEKATGKEVHTDGTQIYGAKGIDVRNVFFKNCRFEIPSIHGEDSSASVNACIMLQMEYSNANGVGFTDCIVNGGGYTIFARGIGECTLNNVIFDGIKVGCAKTTGALYPTISPNVILKNFGETDSLYIASVWKEFGKTHFSVSNDTNQERKLFIYTDKGSYEYVIPACPTGKQFVSAMSYADMPFDIDIVVPEDCEYAVCYDKTLEGWTKQIRFANWSNEQVYVEKKMVDEFSAMKDDVLFSGKCGKNIEFSLTKEGVLTLRGEGATYDYNSTKVAPWSECIGYIKEIRVESGIEKLGAQVFRNCSGVKQVYLSEGLTTIGTRAFSGCTSLMEITLPSTLQNIGEAVFAGGVIQNVYLESTSSDNLQLGKNNEVILDKIVVIEGSNKEEPEVIMQGDCGKKISYTLTEDGTLTLRGTGVTYNYNSSKVAPWYECREMIKKVVVEEGVENVGDQLFRNCVKLECVELPDSLLMIKSNTFISCSNLKVINLPRKLTSIGKYAFAGTKIQCVFYEGSMNEWNNVAVGAHNGDVFQNICCKIG